MSVIVQWQQEMELLLLSFFIYIGQLFTFQMQDDYLES